MTGLDLGNLVAHLRVDATQWQNTLDSVKSRFQRLGHDLESLGRRLSISVTAPLTGMVKSYASFQDAMTKAFAMFGNLSDEMKEKMTRNAEEISLRSSMTATELAEGYRHLGSAGFDAVQSLNLLSLAERFAVAGSFDLGRATVFMADSLRALGLSTDDPIQTLKNIRRVTDNFSQANIMASGEIFQFAKALTEESGQAMKVWGIQLEEGMAVLAAYHAQNMKGEEAGTAFGRMLRLMTQGFRENRLAWDELGVSVFNAEGEFRNLFDILDDLTKISEKLSTEDIGKMFKALGFEARSQQVIMPLLGKADMMRKFYEQLMKATEGTGKTAEIAAINLSSFKEQLVMIWHHVTWLSRDVGRLLAPSIEKVADYLKTLSRVWFGMDESMRSSIVKWAAIIGVLGPALITMVMAVKIFGMLGVVVLGLLNPFTLLIVLAYTFRAAWNGSFSELKDSILGLEVVFQHLYTWLGDQTAAFLDWFKNAWKQANEEIAKGQAGFWKYPINYMVAEGSKQLKEFIPDLVATGAAAERLWNMTNQEFWDSSIVERMAAAFVESRDAIGPLKEDIKGVGVVVADTFKKIPTYAEATVLAVKERAKMLGTDIATQFEKDFKAMSTQLDTFVGKYVEKGTAITVEQEIQKNIDAIETQLEKIGLERGGEKGDLSSLRDNQRELNRMIDALKNEYTQLGKTNEARERAAAILEFETKATDAYGGEIERRTEKVKEYTEALDKLLKGRRGIAAFHSTMGEWASDAQNIWQNLGDIMVSTFDRASKSLTDMIMEGKGNFQDFARAIIADLLQMMIRWQMAAAMTSFFPGFFGGMGAVKTAPIGDINPAMAGVAHKGISVDYLPRLHSGFRPDEFPAIIQRGEQIIPKYDANKSRTPSVVINNNTGQNIKQSGSPKFDGKQWVVTLVTDTVINDLVSNGPIRQVMGGTKNNG